MVKYRVLVYAATGTDFHVGNLVAEFENAKNIGWAKYLNDIGEAFWTVNQDDAKINIRSHEGTAHVKILRNSEVVWRGILAEHEADEDEVVFYAYSYEHVLYHLLTNWNQTWTNKKIAGASGRPVDDIWARVKTDLTYSQLGFATTGTIQAPVTTSGGSTDITLPSYKVYYKRALFCFKELVAIAVSDTTNVCYFELAHTATVTDNAVTFNFWKNKSTDRTSLLWEYGGLVRGFSDRHVPISARNQIKGVGSGAKNQLFRESVDTSTGTRGWENFGRRQEPIYLQWVRDESDLLRVTKLRAAKALREDVDVYLKMVPDAVVPVGASAAGWALGDRVPVLIDRGITQIDKLMFVTGVQVLVMRGAEYVRPMLADRSGT